MVVSRAVKTIDPVRLCARVAHGFGRGSKQLGFPTANMSIRWDAAADPSASLDPEERAVLEFASHHPPGIYCAFGLVDGVPDGGVHKVAMSMGWNPTFADVKAKTIEPWILHKFEQDFYGHELRLIVLGYIRPECKFATLEELKEEIAADGRFCSAALDRPEFAAFREDAFFRRPTPRATASSGSHAASSSSSSLLPALSGLPPLSKGGTRLLLVRHGETEANAAGHLCGGAYDSELTLQGQAQARRLGEELKLAAAQLQWDVALVGSSPLKRAKASADAIADCFPAAEREVFEALREMGYGLLEGARMADVRGEVSAVAQRWRVGQTGHKVGGPEGESPEELATRALAAIRDLLAARPGRTVILVCHMWVNKALVASLAPAIGGLARLGEVPQRNCAVNVLDFCPGEGQGFQVHAVNLTAAAPRSKC